MAILPDSGHTKGAPPPRAAASSAAPSSSPSSPLARPTPSPPYSTAASYTTYHDAESDSPAAMPDVDSLPPLADGALPRVPPPGYSPSEADPPTVEESLQDLALAIPDSESTEVGEANTAPSSGVIENSTPRSAEWARLLGLSGQGVSAANAATSMGFTAARYGTAFSLNIAKRVAQTLVALPAFALDGALGNGLPDGTHGRDAPTASQTAHAAVGGLFDVISTLALGGIDIGSALTSAGLGAAGASIEGVRRLLGSEVMRSLSAFSRLVSREWNVESDLLPPGGIPHYSTLRVTQALTTWVCVQMVTRDYYENRMLNELTELDFTAMQAEHEAEAAKQKAASERRAIEGSPAPETTPGAPAPGRGHEAVRITSENALPGAEGDIIGAEIGTSPEGSVAGDVPPAPDSVEDAPHPEPLSPAEALQGLRRYSKLVLGVYGGVALAWLGRLPPNVFTAQEQELGSVTDGEAARVGGGSAAAKAARDAGAGDAPMLGPDAPSVSRQNDESEFLRAAAAMDLDDAELESIDREYAQREREAQVQPQPQGSGSSTPGDTMPGAFGSAPTRTQPANEIVFSSEPEALDGLPAAVETGAVAAAPAKRPTAGGPSYIDIITGRHDSQLFHSLAGLPDGAAQEGNYADTEIGSNGRPVRGAPRAPSRVARPSQPRYYVVVDHPARRVILVLRGSLSLGDIAIDLTCESADFQWREDHGVEMPSQTPATASSSRLASDEAMPDYKDETGETQPRLLPRSADQSTRDIVHEGMYETAKDIGEPGRPVHRAVARALRQHPGYSLEITGHSLGAGVASLLALMWASPVTCLTIPSSGLPAGRRVHAFAFSVPCVMGAKLGLRCASLVTSFVYSYDLVSRLSLGSILDIRNAAAWICYEDSQPERQAPANGPSNAVFSLRMTSLIRKAFRHQAGRLDADPRAKADVEMDMLAVRKTLEASMQQVELYPPGNVLYAFAPGDLAVGAKAERLFHLRHDGKRENVFGQITFDRKMLSYHMPQEVDRVLHSFPSLT
ncbi:hypothetical protein FA09DRAFT_338404 [Tilletiopsis washingtonensis]|uniref:sn-1-specific diacylglycerol lipase n=1 Tax=Tilletiopsis washingtonensis TaxID=58919 RepID=A0A316ZAH8_9BASI|nr:hypothetical protein FA09DRAFT_338404 [Tilletiopsis washingtonensis]PWN98549.1 hypothetical protein FA09DRAFT_338404 [Tilletiopsis washingtonensis]